MTYEGLNIPNTPINVDVVPGCDPSRVRAYGPGKDYFCVNNNVISFNVPVPNSCVTTASSHLEFFDYTYCKQSQKFKLCQQKRILKCFTKIKYL